MVLALAFEIEQGEGWFVPNRANAKRSDSLDWQPARAVASPPRPVERRDLSAQARACGCCGEAGHGERIGGVGGVGFECGGGSVGGARPGSGTFGTWTSHPGQEHTASRRHRGRDALEGGV